MYHLKLGLKTSTALFCLPKCKVELWMSEADEEKHSFGEYKQMSSLKEEGYFKYHKKCSFKI